MSSPESAQLWSPTIASSEDLQSSTQPAYEKSSIPNEPQATWIDVSSLSPSILVTETNTQRNESGIDDIEFYYFYKVCLYCISSVSKFCPNDLVTRQPLSGTLVTGTPLNSHELIVRTYKSHIYRQNCSLTLVMINQAICFVSIPFPDLIMPSIGKKRVVDHSTIQATAT